MKDAAAAGTYTPLLELVAEPFRVLVVANFPVNFTPEAARRLGMTGIVFQSPEQLQTDFRSLGIRLD